MLKMETSPEAGGEVIPLPEATSGTQKSDPSTKPAGAFGSRRRPQMRLLRLVQATGLRRCTHAPIPTSDVEALHSSLPPYAPPSLAVPAGSLTGHARIAGKHSLSFPSLLERLGSGGGSKNDLCRGKQGFFFKS